MRLKRIALAAFALTVADAFCSGVGVYCGAIVEANPIFREAMAANPLFTGAVLCAVVGALLYILYSQRGRVRWVGPALTMIAAVKLAVIGLHSVWIARTILFCA